MVWYQNPYVHYVILVVIAVLTGALLTSFTPISPQTGFIIFLFVVFFLAFLYERIEIE
ncbi:MAG: hypothetical protein ABEJ58_07620 [Halodesulfurarchaeum sp.]